MNFNFSDPKDNVQISNDLLEKHLNETKCKIVTRFPPESNGFLYLGHAKAMNINFGFAKAKNGICYLRFDDTNPAKERQEYIDSILEDMLFLGHVPYRVTYTSDYFDILYENALKLIKTGKAYVDELDQETMQKQRYNKIESPYRNRSIDESLKLFDEMKNGLHKENSIVLRLKIDMNDDNPNMRDPVAYRILFKNHPRTGNKWCIYPSYDYSHPIVDSLENITHSLCSIEFQIRNKLYKWIPDALNIYKAPQIEYSRLNISHTVLSKRKLIQLVENNIVDGWDDPRLPTIKGLKRKGYTANSINEFCNRIGISVGISSQTLVNYELLEECLRHDLEDKTPRVMAIINPLKVIITNLSDDHKIMINALDFPNLKEKSTTHLINVRNVVYIEKDDFRMQDSPNYFRLAPNKIVRLKYFGLIKCNDVIKDNNNNITELHVELLPVDYNPCKRIKGTINWISDIDHSLVEIRKYDHLFPKQLNDSKEWLSQLNMNSKEIITVMTDNFVLNTKPYTKFQFERIGYFLVDPDTSDKKIVMNMITALKQSNYKNN